MAAIITETSLNGTGWSAGDELHFTENGIERLKVSISGELTKKLSYTGQAIFTEVPLVCFVNVLYTLALVDGQGRVLHTFFDKLKSSEIAGLSSQQLIFSPDAAVLDSVLSGSGLKLRLRASCGLMVNQVYPGSEQPALPADVIKTVKPVLDYDNSVSATLLVKNYYDRVTDTTVTGPELYDTLFGTGEPGVRYALVKGRSQVKAVFLGYPESVNFGGLTRPLGITRARAGGFASAASASQTGEDLCIETDYAVCSADTGKITVEITDSFGTVSLVQTEVMTFTESEPAIISGWGWRRCDENGNVPAGTSLNTFVEFTAGDSVIRPFSLSRCSLRIEYREKGSSEDYETAGEFVGSDAIEDFKQNGFLTDALLRSKAYNVRLVITDLFSGEQVISQKNISVADRPENSDAVIFTGGEVKTVEFPWPVKFSGGLTGKTVTVPSMLSQLTEPGLYYFPSLENGGHVIDDSSAETLTGTMGMLVFGSGDETLHVLFADGGVSIF